MKRLILLVLVFATVLCGCVVGPEERPQEPLVSQDVSAVPAEPEPPASTLPDDIDDIIEPVETDDVVDPDPEPDVTAEPAPVEDPVTTPDLDFDIDMYDAEETMYSTISLNVRSGPSVDFESIGSLREGQAATIVGRASTGWYMIVFNGGYGYVSGAYMTFDDPNPEPEPEPEPDPVYPQLDPLDHAARAAIAEDYERANGLEAGTAYIMGYYGAYSGGDAVVMWTYDYPNSDVSTPLTDDIKEFTVAGRQFYLSSGSLSITIHTSGGRFIELSEAYAQGLVTADELDMISYYNLPSWYR